MNVVEHTISTLNTSSVQILKAVISVLGLTLRVYRRQEHIRISSLEANNRTYSDDTDKANILNNYFSTVFTEEDTIHLPLLEDSIYPPIDHLHITVDGVSCLLHDLKAYKASGGDFS